MIGIRENISLGVRGEVVAHSGAEPFGRMCEGVKDEVAFSEWRWRNLPFS